MSRGNIILSLVIILVIGIWAWFLVLAPDKDQAREEPRTEHAGNKTDYNINNNTATMSVIDLPKPQKESSTSVEKAIAETKKAMQEASKELDFIQAAQYRDEMYRLEKVLAEKKKE